VSDFWREEDVRMHAAGQRLSEKRGKTYLTFSGAFSSMWSGEGWALMRRRRAWRPPTDVYETDANIVVRVEIAGVREEDFQLSLADRRLVISGWRNDPTEKLACQRMEINYGEFRTEIHLPWPLREDEIEAVYEDGFLSVLLPKRRGTRVPLIVVEDDDS
jgi:HSP20 family protein